MHKQINTCTPLQRSQQAQIDPNLGAAAEEYPNWILSSDGIIFSKYTHIVQGYKQRGFQGAARAFLHLFT